MNFTKTQIQNYLDNLAKKDINLSDFQKKIHSVEVFLTWLEKKHILKQNDYAKFLQKIQVLKSKKQYDELSKQQRTETVVLEKKSFNQYIPYKPRIISLLRTGIIITVILGSLYICIYYMASHFSPKAQERVESAESLGRVLSYKGTLKSVEGTPIDTKTDVTFKLYSQDKGGEVLYTGLCVGQEGIEPSYNGSFTVLIGSDCGMKEIPHEIFTNNKDVYLGVTISSGQELRPRQNVSKVSYAVNADKIKGISVGTGLSTIPFIDQNGRLLIEATSPTIQSSEGTFTLEGQTINLQTTPGSMGSIIINPDIGGNTIISNGNVGLGTAKPQAKLDIAGDISMSGSIFFRSLKSGITQLHGGDLTFSTSEDIQENAEERMIIKNNGFVGIGNPDPHYLLSVTQSTDKMSVGSFTNTATTDGNETSVLRLNLGTAASGKQSRFIDFYANSSEDNNGTAVGRVRLNNQGVVYETSGADFAEYFNVSEQTEAGHIISMKDGLPHKSREGESLIGVVSDVAGFIGNASTTEGKTVVGLIGQINTFVSTLNGEIREGDAISSSSIEGYGSKAIKPGYIVGKAMESSEFLKNEFCPENIKNLIDTNNNLIRCGKVKVLVNSGWYDPQVFLTQSGNINGLDQELSRITEENSSYENLYSKFKQKSSQLNQAILQLSIGVKSYSESIFTKTNYLLVQNYLVAKNITTQQIAALDAQLINIKSEKIVSPIIESEQIKTRELTTATIKPADNKVEIDLNPEKNNTTTNSEFAELVIKGLDDKPVASIDNAGNATFSGTLNAQEASIEGTLYAKNVQSDNINQLEQSVGTLNNTVNGTQTETQLLRSEANALNARLSEIQSQLTTMKEEPIPNANLYQQLDQNLLISTSASTLAQSYDDLIVTGKANLFSARVTDTFAAGTLFIQDNTIAALGEELTLTALNQITFFEGSIILSKDGTIRTKAKIIAEGGIQTDRVESLTGNVNIQLGNSSDNKLAVTNGQNQEVASIDNAGNADFSRISLDTYNSQEKPDTLITPAENFDKHGIYAHALETNSKSAGTGFLPQNTKEIIIYNTALNENSLVYLTNTSSTANTNLAVAEKNICISAQIGNCVNYFKVVMNDPQEQVTTFNWLIIN